MRHLQTHAADGYLVRKSIQSVACQSISNTLFTRRRLRVQVRTTCNNSTHASYHHRYLRKIFTLHEPNEGDDGI